MSALEAFDACIAACRAARADLRDVARHIAEAAAAAGKTVNHVCE